MARYEHTKIFQLCYGLTLKVYKITSNFKKEHKYTLGEKLKMTCHEILDLVVESNAKEDKRESIRRLDAKLETFRIFFRIAFDLNAVSGGPLREITSDIAKIGEQVGGWQKWADKNCGPAPAGVSGHSQVGSGESAEKRLQSRSPG